jgi:2-haloacid dehalogenase
MDVDTSPLVVFDAYGTLLDIGSAVGRYVEAVGPDATRLVELWRSKQLEYTWVLSLAGRYGSFWELTTHALDYALSVLPSVDRGLREPLLNAYRRLSAYPEVPDVLKALRERGTRVVVLSNGDRAMLDEAFASAGLTPFLDRIVSVEEVGVFKPSPTVYALIAPDGTGARHAVTFTSSNRWDIGPFRFHCGERVRMQGASGLAAGQSTPPA